MMTKKKKLWNKASLSLVVLFLGGWFVLQTFTGADKPQTNNKNKTETQELNYAVKQPTIPKTLELAGETVPTHLFDVYEAVDNEFVVNSYWHSSTIQTLKRAARFFPVIEPILESHGVPDDFKYLCVIESNLRNVTSPAGAKGFWQFMESTGKEYGLEINSYVDERFHLEKSTHAACEYLKKSYEKFGSWTLAAASYNMGSGGLGRRIKEQKVDNYYDLLLNSETARYVYRIIAMKYMMPEHEAYGFIIEDKFKYQPLETEIIEVDTAINSLVDFAFEHGTNYKTLKTLNPWLTNKYLINKSGKVYEITIPKADTRASKNAVENFFED
ncbi:MAG: lytic transglycosylase domain-containing protein [Bacteroidales bacterium]|jgi:membrane-bound lytic murein transglycosylase D|nr:lytic transglycosylase domain-containing protein [Bacteroidales bacterium]